MYNHINFVLFEIQFNPNPSNTFDLSKKAFTTGVKLQATIVIVNIRF